MEERTDIQFTAALSASVFFAVSSSGGSVMRSLYRWFTEQLREIDRAMEQMRDFSSRPGVCQQAKFTPWAPATEVFSERGDLVIRVEVPGLEPDEVDLTLEDGLLTISGERKVTPEASEARHYYLREPLYGPFRRTVSLPTMSEESGETHTEFGDGVLEIVIQGAAPGAGQVKLAPSTSTC